MSIRMITILLWVSRTAKHGHRQRAVTVVKDSGELFAALAGTGMRHR
jgi:hypothetical protein